MKRGLIKILYEDNNVLVINKPAGLAVHNDAMNNQEYTVVDWLLEKYPKIKNVGEDKSRPGIVHRLDKDTSGVLVMVKNQAAHAFIKRQFQGREIKKVYLAIVHGDVKKDVGIIDRPIGRSRNDYHAKATGTSARGGLKNAITYYKTLERFPGYTLLELRPKTGRTHQIRVHLKSISHPIVCDSVYAKKKPCLGKLGRQALHALSIEFKLPSGDVKIEAPIPKDFKNTLAYLRGL